MGKPSPHINIISLVLPLILLPILFVACTYQRELKTSEEAVCTTKSVASGDVVLTWSDVIGYFPPNSSYDSYVLRYEGPGEGSGLGFAIDLTRTLTPYAGRTHTTNERITASIARESDRVTRIAGVDLPLGFRIVAIGPDGNLSIRLEDESGCTTYAPHREKSDGDVCLLATVGTTKGQLQWKDQDHAHAVVEAKRRGFSLEKCDEFVWASTPDDRVCRISLTSNGEWHKKINTEYVAEAVRRGMTPNSCIAIIHSEFNDALMCKLSIVSGAWSTSVDDYLSVKEAKRRGLSPAKCASL